MPTLPSAATLADLQAYIAEMEVERGFSDQSTIEKCLLLGEEVGPDVGDTHDRRR